MRYVVVGAASLAAFAQPAIAQDFSGYASLGIATNEVESDSGGEAEDDGVAIAAATVFDAGSTLKAELEGGFTDGDGDSSAIGVAGHLYAQSGEARFGGFLGLSEVDDAATFSLGVEGAHTMNDVAVRGSAYYANRDGDGGPDVSMLGATGQAAYFIHSKLQVSGLLGIGSAEADGADGDFYWTAGIGAEYMLDALPLSLYGGYVRTDYDGFDVAGFRIGARYHLDVQTLASRAGRGPIFSGLNSLVTGFGTPF